MKIWKLISGISVLSLAVAAQSAMAQEAPAEEISDESVGEIIVTAQKREQSTNDVGMSIAAFAGDTLAERNISDPSELGRLVPAFTATRSNFGFPTYTLRGVGFYESSLSAAPTVSVYVDEVPLPYPSMTSGAILDLERIEVLKGPQGILFGQNSTGGAINYIAAKPTKEFSAGAQASYGRFGAFEAEGFVSAPLGELFAARLAIKTAQGGAWQYSLNRPTDKLGDKNFLAGRFILEFNPSSNFRISLNLNGWRDKGDTQATQTAEIVPVNPAFPVNPNALNSLITRFNPRVAEWTPTLVLKNDKTFYQASARVDWDVSDAVTLTSITAYQDYEQRSIEDFDGTIARTIDVTPTGRVKSFSQEFRASGTGIDNRLNWVIGGNFTDDRINEEQIIFQGQSTGAFVDLAPGLLPPFQFNSVSNQARARIKSWAMFGNAEFQLTERLGIQAGLRLTRSKNDYTGCVADTGPGDFAAIFQFIQGAVLGIPVTAAPGQCITLRADFTSGPFTGTLDEDNVSYRIGFNWKPLDNDTLIYANISQGYKSGSFPTLAATLATQLLPVTQEKLVAYEAGFKAPIASTAQLNGAVFYYDYSNKQFRGRVQDPIFGQLERLINIPKSRIQGAELQFLWRPIDNLTLSSNAAYVDSKILKNPDGTDFANFPQRTNPAIPFAGNSFPYTPKWQVSADAEYEFAVSSNISAFVGGSLTYQSLSKAALEDSDPDRPRNVSATAGAAYNDPALLLPAYTLIDLRLGIKGSDDRWRASLWAKNITNEYYYVNAINNRDTLNRYAAPPATYGVTLAYRF